MKIYAKIYAIILFITFNNIMAQSENENSSFILTTNNEKIAIEPDFPIYHTRNGKTLFCRLPSQISKANSFDRYFKTAIEEIDNIVDGERTYIPILLKDKKKKKKKKKNINTDKKVFARVIAKKENLILLTFNYNHGTVSMSGSVTSPRAQFIIINDKNEVVINEGIMNNYDLREEERHLIIDENAQKLNEYFGECLERSHLKLFDFRFNDNIELNGRKTTRDSIPLLLWKNNGIDCN